MKSFKIVISLLFTINAFAIEPTFDFGDDNVCDTCESKIVAPLSNFFSKGKENDSFGNYKNSGACTKG